jgi:hypothetical protein
MRHAQMTLAGIARDDLSGSRAAMTVQMRSGGAGGRLSKEW